MENGRDFSTVCWNSSWKNELFTHIKHPCIKPWCAPLYFHYYPKRQIAYQTVTNNSPITGECFFYKNVMVENEKPMQCEQPKKYESPKEQLFIERGCYTQQEFNASTGRIGIPQGGALSGLNSNFALPPFLTSRNHTKQKDSYLL